MRRMMLALGAAAALLGARSARAQDSTRAGLGIDRVGTYVSYTWMPRAKHGWELGGDIDLGSIGPRARLLLGADYYSADVNVVGPLGTPLTGGFHDFAISTELRVRLFQAGRVAPFAGAGAGVHFLGNDIGGDPAYAHRFTGVEGGAQFFGGTEVAVTRDGGIAAYGELRRLEARAVSRTTVRLGVFVKL